MAGFEIIGLIGSLVSAAGSIAAGNSQAAIANYEAQLMQQKANEERAVSQQEAEQRRKKQEYVLSQQRAVAAASGAGVGGEGSLGILDIAGDTAKEGFRQERVALWEGETKGRDYEAQAAIKRASAKAAQQSGRIGALSTVLTGASKMKIGGSMMTMGDFDSPYNSF